MVTDTDGFIGIGFTRGLVVVQNPPVPLAAEQDPPTAGNRCAFCYALTIPPVYSIPQGSGRGSAKAYRSAAGTPMQTAPVLSPAKRQNGTPGTPAGDKSPLPHLPSPCGRRTEFPIPGYWPPAPGYRRAAVFPIPMECPKRRTTPAAGPVSGDIVWSSPTHTAPGRLPGLTRSVGPAGFRCPPTRRGGGTTLPGTTDSAGKGPPAPATPHRRDNGPPPAPPPSPGTPPEADMPPHPAPARPGTESADSWQRPVSQRPFGVMLRSHPPERKGLNRRGQAA